MTTATAPPATPSRGSGPHPKMRQGDKGIRAAAPTEVTAAGIAMLPVPRITFASELKTQIRIAPEKAMLEYVSAAVREGPCPPMAALTYSNIAFSGAILI